MADQSGQTPSSRGKIATTISEIAAERRWFTMMRLAFSGVCLAWLLLVLWAMPGGPFADIVTGFSASTVLGFLFALAAFGGTVCCMVLWRPSFKGESAHDFVHVLLGGGLLVRRRAQFKARLAAECRRTRRGKAGPFSIIVLKLDRQAASREDPTMRRFGGQLPLLWARSVARGDDIVGDAAADEIWILAREADEQGRTIMVARLAQELASDERLPHFAGVEMAAVTFGDDGEDADTLLLAAAENLAMPGELLNRAA
ncbi:MAG: hypothetical protein IH865_09650 [Chloroflexi bacterium]|nr:hypothetical protein [Chloroflexota bacterium]